MLFHSKFRLDEKARPTNCLGCAQFPFLHWMLPAKTSFQGSFLEGKYPRWLAVSLNMRITWKEGNWCITLERGVGSIGWIHRHFLLSVFMNSYNKSLLIFPKGQNCTRWSSFSAPVNNLFLDKLSNKGRGLMTVFDSGGQEGISILEYTFNRPWAVNLSSELHKLMNGWNLSLT